MDEGVEQKQTEKTEQEKSFEEILADLDKHFDPAKETLPSQAWQYRETVRAKYRLPESSYRWQDPVRYIREIEELAKERGIEIRPKHEFETFFKENPEALALSSGPDVFRENTIVVGSVSENDWWGLRRKASQYSHEIVHGLQNISVPRMPDKEAEREAFYYQMLDPNKIREFQNDPEVVKNMIKTIETCVQSSTKIDEKINDKAPDGKI